MHHGVTYDGRIVENYCFTKEEIKEENKILVERGWDFDTNQYIQKLILGGMIIGRKQYYTNDILHAPRP